jgi:hypothetical protein
MFGFIYGYYSTMVADRCITGFFVNNFEADADVKLLYCVRKFLFYSVSFLMEQKSFRVNYLN